MPTTSLVRASVLEGYDTLARSIGLVPEAELARVGISADALANPGGFISFLAFIRLLEHTAHAGQCPDFGLRLVRQQAVGRAGPLHVLMRHAATLEEALRTGSRHLFVLSPKFQFGIVPVAEDPQWVDLTVEIDLPRLRSRAQAIEHALGWVIGLLRSISQGRVRPVLALLPHRRQGSALSYAEVLGCRCRFDAPIAAARIAASELALPLPEHDRLLEQMALSYIDGNFCAPQRLFTGQVRMHLRRLLGTGAASQPAVAEALAVHPKTLQRRLVSEGRRFHDLLDEVRRDRLMELLSQPVAPNLTQVAQTLGYSEQAVLSRSCRRWFGRTPTQLLQEQRMARPRDIAADPRRPAAPH